MFQRAQLESSTGGARVIPVPRRGVAALLVAIGIAFAPLLPLRQGYCAASPAPLLSEAQRPGAEFGPTRVSTGVWVSNISRIDSVAQTFSASLFIVLNWVDPRLAHGGSGTVRYELKNIWHHNGHDGALRIARPPYPAHESGRG